MKADMPSERHRLDLTLYSGVALGVIGGSYFVAASQGWCVTSACGLLWPASTAILLGMTTVLAAATTLTKSAQKPYLAAAALVTVVLITLNLLPPFARDELTHHLAIPELYLKHGRAVTIPFAEQSYFPMQLTILYTPLLAQGWESLPKQLHMLFGLGAVSILYLYLIEKVSPAIAAFTAILVLTTPTFVTLATSAYVDLGLLFFSTVSIIALLRWSETDRISLLATAGFAAGCAGAVKYNGYLTIVVALAGAIALAPNKSPRILIRNALVFGLAAGLPLVPWMVRNYLDTGNPMFPLMRGMLGGPPRPDSPSVDIFTRRRFLYNESWLEVMTTPFRAFVTGRNGDPARFDGVFNPLLLLGFAALWIGRRSQPKKFLTLAAFALLLLVFLLTTFRSRYAIASLVPLAVLTAYALDELHRSRPQADRAIAALGAAALAFNLWHFGLYWNDVSPLGYLSGRESRSDFITRFVPEFPLSEYASQHLPPGATVYLAFLGQRGYYWKCSYTYDFYYSGTSIRDAVRAAETPEEVARELKRTGISHIAAAAPLLGRFLKEDLTEKEMSRWAEFATRHLRLIRTQGAFGLYEIVS